jgi:hypothetical protein
VAPPADGVARLPARRLKPAERARLAIEILSSYRQVRRMMRRKSIAPTVHTLRGEGSVDSSHGNPQAALYEAWRLGQAVQRTLRLAPGDTRCLTRSLVLTRVLARRGISSQLVIGARTKPSFQAHAWVEQAGQPVLPAGDDSYGRLVEL